MGHSDLQPFHLAFPVDDLSKAEVFYAQVLECQIGRRSDRWIDFNFFGHQIVAHLTDAPDDVAINTVDGEAVPIRHFGLIVSRDIWENLIKKLSAAEIDFLIKPQIRFKGEAGEQGTFFVKDPSGNALEFKFFDDPKQIFAT